MLAITPGDCAAAQLRAADLAEDVLPWRDLLHEGPVPAGLDPVGLARVRAEFVSAQGWADPAEAAATFAERDATLAEAAAKPAEIVLWFDTNLVNRLALLQVLDRLAELRPGLDEVTLAEPVSFGGATAGQLTQLATHRRPISTDRLTRARGAWAAFRAADPTRLVEYTVDQGPLGAALRIHLQQFPHVGDGLAGTERRALAAVAAGAREFPDVYRAVTAADAPPWLGDSVLRSHLDRLATAAHPLVARDAAGGWRITPDGSAVLSGRADHVARNGIDRWLGGVHLTGGNVWRFDPDPARLVR